MSKLDKKDFQSDIKVCKSYDNSSIPTTGKQVLLDELEFKNI
ncbi:hypothetical protein [Lacihabitans soyangensis]|nr:hypothetical protein [Lacihabitans soyangensis]